MDLVARLDPSNARWSDGSVENIKVTVTRTDGDLDVEDFAGIGIGSSTDEPLVWYPPTGAVHDDILNAVTGRLLIGAAVQPVGRVYVWAKVTRGSEVAYRCDIRTALDFTGVTWPVIPPPVTAVLLFNPDGSIAASDTTVTVLDNQDGSFSPLIDNGDGSYDLGVAA